MDEIVSKLSEIELVAVKIMEYSVARKKELALIMEGKTKDFDVEINIITDKKIKELKEQLNIQVDQELDQLRKMNEKSLKELEVKYNSNHTIIVKDLLNKIIGVKLYG